LSSRFNIPCVIIAGGASRRFGTAKALAVLNSKPLITHVFDGLQLQTSVPVVINTNDTAVFSKLPCPCIADILSKDVGPLAGLHAALSWAEINGHKVVVTSPLDTPFLPADLIERLSADGKPAIAKSGTRAHPLCGYWPTALRALLEQEIEAGMRAAHDWIQRCNASEIEFEITNGVDPFMNINTREDLERAAAAFRDKDQ